MSYIELIKACDVFLLYIVGLYYYKYYAKAYGMIWPKTISANFSLVGCSRNTFYLSKSFNDDTSDFLYELKLI